MVSGLSAIGGVAIHGIGVPDDADVPGAVRPSNTTTRAPANKFAKLAFDMVRAGTLAARTPSSIYHGVDGFLPFGTPRRMVRMLTAYDLGFLRYPELFDTPTRLLNTWHARTRIAEAHKVLAISVTTADDLMALLGIPSSRIAVVWSGYSDFFSPGDELMDTEPPFFLAVGGANPRKNLVRVISAFSEWRRHSSNHRDATLRVTGHVDSKFQQRLGSRVEHVTFEGFVDRSRLRDLYRSTAGLAFPAVYEGFGIPILEAMASGAPVMTSHHGATAEVAGDAAVLVDPMLVTSIARGFEHMLEAGQTLRSAGIARARAFSWRHTAEAIRTEYDSAIR
ncbi:MAG: glycosyltransferase family 4 protein [Gemmatimonadaceae bacterium]|nr:glycosyltransferase family 4 protein [Gemmatimonadaceae bacterium]